MENVSWPPLTGVCVCGRPGSKENNGSTGGMMEYSCYPEGGKKGYWLSLKQLSANVHLHWIDLKLSESLVCLWMFSS